MKQRAPMITTLEQTIARRDAHIGRLNQELAALRGLEAVVRLLSIPEVGDANLRLALSKALAAVDAARRTRELELARQRGRNPMRRRAS